MATYPYKAVESQIPAYIIQKQGKGYEGSAGYDGDLWEAASAYIMDLEKALKLALAGKVSEIDGDLLEALNVKQ